jgi:hypothetical protein
MQVLKWLECLMFIPISQWLQSWGLSIVNFTDSWDFKSLSYISILAEQVWDWHFCSWDFKSLSYISILPEQAWDWRSCSYRCVFFLFLFVSVFPSLVLFVASWGSVDLAVSSSFCESRFLYYYGKYFFLFLFFWAIFSIYEIASPGLHPFLLIPWTARVCFLLKPWVLFQFIVWRNWTSW